MAMGRPGSLAPRLLHQYGKAPTGGRKVDLYAHVADDQLRDDVEARLLIRDGLDNALGIAVSYGPAAMQMGCSGVSRHTDREDENHANQNGDDIGPPCEVRLVDLRGNQAKGEADGKSYHEPL